jgi:sulfate adenylyltransferase subunit 2
MIWTANEHVFREAHEEVHEKMVRFRTVGDMTCTAAVLSEATSLDDVVSEIRESTISERGARIDDKRSEAAMETRKKVGYF